MSNVFRDALAEAGITSGSQLAERMHTPAAIFFLVGQGRPYAELRFWDANGVITAHRHWPNSSRMTVATARRRTVEAAQAEAAKLLALPEWGKSPFSNCWLPLDVLQEARKEFLEPVETA